MQKQEEKRGVLRKRYNHCCIILEIDHLTELEFQKMFRMKRDSFEKLYNTLELLLYSPNLLDAINITFQIGIPISRDKLRHITNSFTRFTSEELWEGCLHFFFHIFWLN